MKTKNVQKKNIFDNETPYTCPNEIAFKLNKYFAKYGSNVIHLLYITQVAIYHHTSSTVVMKLKLGVFQATNEAKNPEDNKQMGSRKSAGHFTTDWCHPRKIVAFGENRFCRNLKTDKVKYIKVYISRKEFYEESI